MKFFKANWHTHVPLNKYLVKASVLAIFRRTPVSVGFEIHPIKPSLAANSVSQLNDLP